MIVKMSAVTGHVSCLTGHVSCLTGHVSCLTGHVSCFIDQMSYFICQMAQICWSHLNHLCSNDVRTFSFPFPYKNTKW